MKFCLLLLSLFLVSSPSFATGPDFSGLGSRTGTLPVAASQEPGRTPPRDSLDALLRDLPGGSPELEEWYQEWKESLPGKAETRADPLRGSRETFSGFFGESAGTARRNQEVVLLVLDALTPPDPRDPERNVLLEQMLRALASHATDSKSSRGTTRKKVVRGGRSQFVSQPRPRPKGNAEEVYQRLRGLAESGIGPESAGVLEDLRFSPYDFKAAAFVLLEHSVPRREEIEDKELEMLLEDPPDPAESQRIEEVRDLAEEALTASKERKLDSQTARIRDQLKQIKALEKRRTKAYKVLREALGEAAVSDPYLMAAALRRRMQDGSSLAPELREAFLELGRVDANLVLLSELLELPGAEEISLQEDEEEGGDSDRGLFKKMNASTLGQKLSKEVLDADLELSLKLFDLDLAPGVSVSGKYKWEIEGGDRKDTWNRIDQWQLRAAVGVGDWIHEVFDLPFSIGIDHTRKILLVREFDSWKAASLGIPKGVLSLPLSAEKARKMPMGYFWSLPVEMSAVANLAFGSGEGLVSVRAFANYVLSGRFRLNFFKETEDKVRVQLIGAREKGPGYGGEVKLGFEILGISVMDKALARLVDLKVLRNERSWREGLGVALDYVYDLKDPDASRAFERAIKVSLGWGGLLAANPILKTKKMEDRLLTDLRPTEKLFLEDRAKPVDQRRVDRRFLATNQFHVRNRSFRIGPRFARYGKHSRWVENLLTVTHQDGKKNRYQFPMYNYWKGWQLLFGLHKESGELQVFSLMDTGTDREEPEGPQPLLLKATLRDRAASKGEIEKVRAATIRSLGPFLSHQIELDTAAIPSGGKGFRSHVLIAFHPEATGKIFDPQQVSEEAVLQAAVRTLTEDDDGDSVTSKAHRLADAFLLAREIPGGPGNAKQIRALIRLAETQDGRNWGTRFLLEMLGGEPTVEEVHVDVSWTGKGVEEFNRSFGSSRHEDLYLIVSEALAAVADRDRPFDK